MKSPNGYARAFGPSFLLVLPLLIAAARWVGPNQTANNKSLVATYTTGTLHVSIPYPGPYPGASTGPGKLSLEILSPEDQVIGHSEKLIEAAAGGGQWQQDIRLEKPLALDDLAWHRLHYRFEYRNQQSAAIDETESISQILRIPVVHILGQQSYLAGSQAAVRIIVTDSRNEAIDGSGSVRIETLAQGHAPRILFTGRLNRRGTTEAQFRFPPELVGSYLLKYAVETPIGSTEFNQPVRLEDKISILLSTEKPVYQPGQTIHVRALALDRSNHQAVANRKLIFEVEDPRGNKVFKKSTVTDPFGIVTAEFELADEAVFQYFCSGTNDFIALPSARQIPHPRADLPIARV
jgi:hypothetical protein